MVKVNGMEVQAAGKTIKAYLEDNNYVLMRIVVELNEQIIDRDEYDSIVLHDGDVMEVVSFVGGG